MNSLTRRIFLRASAIPAAALVPAIPAIAAPVPQESAELVALGQQIDPLLGAYRTALARYTEARSLAEATCPQVPEELLCKGPQWASCIEYEKDVEGKNVWPPNYVGTDGKTYARMQRHVFNSVQTKEAIERGNLYCNGRTKFGKRIRSMIRTAERYEAERKAAIENSGVLAAADELQWAATDIDNLGWKIRDFAPVTLAGVLIQARALTAITESESHGTGPGRGALILGRQLADAVLRVGEKRGAV